MKTRIALGLGLLLAAAAAWGQGTVNFATRVTGSVDAPVFFAAPGGPTLPADGRMVGQLYAGPPGGDLAAVGMAVPFRSDAGAGYITAGGRVVVPGIPGGSPATIELRAWMASMGATYEAALATSGGMWVARSAPITITLGGGGTPPTPDANLVGLQGMVFPVPESASAVLGWWGMAVLVWFHAGRRGARPVPVGKRASGA